jgi:hypothetical protein
MEEVEEKGEDDEREEGPLVAFVKLAVPHSC